jgi:ATP-dependent DNA helicase RecQ
LQRTEKTFFRIRKLHSSPEDAATLSHDVTVKAISERCAKGWWDKSELYDQQMDAIVPLVRAIRPDQPPEAILVALRTGSGKSLILQIAASLLAGITLVIVPLIALGADQVTKMQGNPKFVALQLDDIKSKDEALGLIDKLKRRYTKNNIYKSN